MTKGKCHNLSSQNKRIQIRRLPSWRIVDFRSVPKINKRQKNRFSDSNSISTFIHYQNSNEQQEQLIFLIFSNGINTDQLEF